MDSFLPPLQYQVVIPSLLHHVEPPASPRLHATRLAASGTSTGLIARAMVTAVVESPLRQRQRQRLRSPLAGDAGSTVGDGVDDDLEVRHLRPAKRASGSAAGGMRGRSAPPEIVIPTNGNGNGALHGIGGGGGGRGYTSLRDIMSSSPKDTVSPNDDEGAPGGGGGVGGGAVVVGIGTAVDVHMIRHPLVKHAAYAYLQLTPSAKEAEARRRMMLQRRRGGGPICRVFFGCFEFLGAFFGCAGD